MYTTCNAVWPSILFHKKLSSPYCNFLDLAMSEPKATLGSGTSLVRHKAVATNPEPQKLVVHTFKGVGPSALPYMEFCGKYTGGSGNGGGMGSGDGDSNSELVCRFSHSPLIDICRA